MRSRLFPGSEPQPVQIDLSLAIVNIVLLLILFFLATGRLLNPTETDVAPPETRDLPFEELPQPLLVVYENERLSLNGNDVQAQNLRAAIVQQLTEPYLLHILIDGAAPAHRLLRLMEDPAFADVELRLVTLHEGAGP